MDQGVLARLNRHHEQQLNSTAGGGNTSPSIPTMTDQITEIVAAVLHDMDVKTESLVATTPRKKREAKTPKTTRRKKKKASKQSK
jgi:hypothetical protein